MLKFEYVASGMGHLRLGNTKYSNYQINDEIVKLVDEANDLISILNRDQHKFSALFNAYTEKKLGETIFNCFNKSLNDIYADSGGLQVVTKGNVVTEEFKNDVYDVQSRFSTIGMSFDEIPVILTSNRSTFHDTSSRYYDPDILIEKAELSGENLKKQIEFFLDRKTVTKPMMILQGNDFESYQIWLDCIIKKVGLNNLKYIKGIASAAAALGQKQLEDVERIFILKHLQFPKELNKTHIHLLGVGSLSRFFPIRALMNNYDYLISYDSTTHTSAINLGSYYLNSKIIPVGRLNRKNVILVLNDINDNLTKHGKKNIDYNQYDDFILNPSIFNTDKYCKDADFFQRNYTIWAYFFSNIFNFTNDVDKMFQSDKFYHKILSNSKCLLEFKALEKCLDFNDFNEWKAVYGKSLPSQKVPRKKVENSLESFFI